jgi:O-antigen/teichoic acid export membrane protein
MAAAQGSYFALQFGGSVILARLLSPHDMGVFAIALAMAGLLALIQAFGLASLIVREAELKPSLAATAFTINAALGLLMAALTAGLGAFGGALLGDAGVARVLLVLALLPLIAIFEFLPAAKLEREGGFRTLAILKAMRSAIAMGLTVGLAFAGHSYMSLAWGQLAGAAFNAVAISIIAWRHVSLRLSFKDWRTVSRFGGQMLAISGVNTLADRVAEILLGRIIDLAALGLYSRASSMFNLLWNNIHIVLARVFLVDFADLARRGIPFRDRYIRIVAIMTGALWPAFGGLAILSGPFVQLVYGPQWLGAALPLSMLSVAALILVSITMTWQLFVVSGETGRQARIEIVRSGFGFALFVAGCFVNLTTAASAKIGDALFSYALYRPHVSRITGTTAADLWPAYRKSAIAAAAAVMPAAVLMIAYGGSPTTPILYVGGAVALGVVLWFLALRLIAHPLHDEIARATRKLAGRANALKAAP